MEEKLVMDLNLNYWRKLDPNVPDQVTMIGTTEAVTVKSLMSKKELEISDAWQSNEAFNSLMKIKGVEVIGYFVGAEFYYMMNTKLAPTDDIHFRKAMSWAFDYQSVINYIVPGAKQSRGPVASVSPGFDSTVFQYHKDLEKAKEELKKSKYYENLDKYPVTLHWCAAVPDEEKVALLFMSNMEEIGIKVDVVKVPWASMVDECAALDTSPNITTTFCDPYYPEAGSMLELKYHSSTANTWQQNEWLLDEKLDGMIEDAIKTVDREERFKEYGLIQHYIVDICPTIFVFDKLERHAYQTEYVDWPSARGECIPIIGYTFYAPNIKIFPEKR